MVLHEIPGLLTMFFIAAKQFIHVIHLGDEVYESHYGDVRNKRFKAAKLGIEYEVR